MMDRSSEALIDRIHEAALVPSRWPVLLSELGDAIGGNGGALFAVRDGYGRAVNSANHDRMMSVFMNDWSALDQTLPRALALGHPGFVTERDLFTEAELDEDEVFREFFRKNGLDYRAGTLIPMPIGDTVAITIFRNHRQGPVQAEHVSFLDGLRPHLARASLTANRLGFERARAQAEALQALGLPGAVLRRGGRVLAANGLFEALMPSLFQDRMNRLAVTDHATDALLAHALVALNVGNEAGIRSIPVGATMERVPMVLHLVPVRGAANDIFMQAAALLVVTPVDRATVPTAEVLQGLFDLTPAEARIARGIGQAKTVDELAHSSGVNRETVRSQLKAVLSKTGLSRQHELISLLAGKMLRNI